MNPPFFVLGVPRSGTTLLSVLLENHSKLYIDGESVGILMAKELEKYKQHYSFEPKQPKEQLLSRIIEKSYKSRLKHLLDYQHLDQYPDLRALFKASVNQRAQANGKEYWGDKTPELLFYIPQLLQVFPDAKFLHIVRDARSNAFSLNKRQYKDMRLAAQYWKEINGKGLVMQHILGRDQYRMFNYEEVVQRPEENFRAICEFLGIEFEQGMLDLAQNEATQKENAYVAGTIDASKIHKWKERMTEGQIRMVEQICGDLMDQLGYTLYSLDDPSKARSISYWKQYFLQEKDLLKQLFKGERVAMIDRQLKKIRIPLSTRLKNFIGGTAKLTFSDAFNRIFTK
jgi:hypothetical protein